MNLQRQLSFLTTSLPGDSAQVWDELDEVLRTEIAVMLAHLIAKMVAEPAKSDATARAEEKNDD